MARPRLRLLIDENLSPRIARALHALGYHVEAVHDAPNLGVATADQRILEVAKERNQVIVTVNLDMVLICVEAEESVIWVDPKRKKGLTYEEMVVRFFEGVPLWERLVAPGVVVHALKTKDEVLSFDQAQRRVLARLAKHRRVAAPRSRPRKADESQGKLGQE